MTTDVYILMTMDCETARSDVTSHSVSMSPSGPFDYEESKRSISGYASIARAYGLPLSLFAHPEVAVGNRGLLLELQEEGACLGLHLHPYKFDDGRYRKDLGGYSAAKQREILELAMQAWQDALGVKPLYFRSGYSSANDNTYRVLHELGFRGAAISNPGRILPEHCSVWSGAVPYPHRTNFEFRQLEGNTSFVDIPVSVDFLRPVNVGHAGEEGFEWPYIPGPYNHKEIIQHLLERFKEESPAYPVIYMDTHNDQDYTDPTHPASKNLELILDSIMSTCADMDMQPIGATVETICDLVLSNSTE